MTVTHSQCHQESPTNCPRAQAPGMRESSIWEEQGLGSVTPSSRAQADAPMSLYGGGPWHLNAPTAGCSAGSHVRALSSVTSSLASPYAGGALTRCAEPAGETPNDL